MQVTEGANNDSDAKSPTTDLETLHIKPIGLLQSCFHFKAGTPRQGSLCPHSKAVLDLKIDIINSDLSLDGLDQFSHVWLLWIFSQNKNTKLQTKIAPPRPNPIGMSLVKLDKIEGTKIYFSSVDIVSGTPIIDIKPYIHFSDSVLDSHSPAWIDSSDHLKSVTYTPQAEAKLHEFLPKCQFYDNVEDLKSLITEVAQQDPRPVHYRQGKYNEIFGFCADILNILCKFEKDSVTIVDIEDWSEKLQKQIL